MKLGKAEILALIECGLFLIGAIFLAIVFINPANPIWALVIGIIFGLAGAIMWTAPLLIKAIKNHQQKKNALPRIDALDKIADEDETYELHRADDYDHLADANDDKASKIDLDF